MLSVWKLRKESIENLWRKSSGERFGTSGAGRENG